MTDDTAEHWLYVVGYEGLYEVSDHGRVRSLDRMCTGPSGIQRFRRGKLMKINLTTNYPQVCLCRNGVVKGVNVHRLVAKAFLGVPENAEKLHVCHDDGDRTNNHLSNLKWGTPDDNWHDMQRHGRDRITAYSPPPQTVCQRGHAMTPENTWVHDGRRRCRECGRMRDRRRYWKQKAG
jgi:hypothetical protein